MYKEINFTVDVMAILDEYDLNIYDAYGSGWIKIPEGDYKDWLIAPERGDEPKYLFICMMSPEGHYYASESEDEDVWLDQPIDLKYINTDDYKSELKNVKN